MTTRGKIVLTLLVLAIVAVGAWKWWERFSATPSQPPPVSTPSATPSTTPTPDTTGKPVALAETQTEIPALAAPAAFEPKDNTVLIELSEYAGYAGLIVANGGLEPNTNSVFSTKHGFKVKITLSEEESWSALNSGKMAASATTVDVLATYGKQFQVLVPAQIGFSRGADGVVVRSDIKRINALKGRTLATAQFTEADFFIRYLAQEAGLGINMLPSLKTAPDPDKLNLVFCTDAFAAGDFFLQDLQGEQRLAGCVTWAPKTGEIVKASNGRAHILATSANLLIVADILVVNRGFAQQHPEMVAGLVNGLLEGNRAVRDNPTAWLDLIGKTFKWDKEQTKAELAKVHLSNLPENLAFFSGAIDAAGSFGGIYQSAVYAYGSQLIKDPVDSDRFMELKHLKALEQGGAFKDQKVAIAPIRTGGAAAAVEGDPLLSKDIRFLFEPNSAKLVITNEANLKNLEVIKKLLQVSPGSVVLLRGHVDNSKVEEFRRQGDQVLRSMAMRAIEFSKQRAAEIKRLLIERHGIDAARLDIVGRGWEEPLGPDQEQNRRVEAQWFTLE
ncbi:MAG TPA: phosphate ABC transporter substrate-binding/OmpA family protein [Verrucomicrobiae bacterium]